MFGYIISMPNRELHNFMNELILGESYDKLNRAIDLPARWLGYRHRKYFHDNTLVMMLLIKDPKAAMAAFIHHRLDFDKRLAKKVEIVKRLVDEGLLGKGNKSGK